MHHCQHVLLRTGARILLQRHWQWLEHNAAASCYQLEAVTARAGHQVVQHIPQHKSHIDASSSASGSDCTMQSIAVAVTVTIITIAMMAAVMTAAVMAVAAVVMVPIMATTAATAVAITATAAWQSAY
eukprot:9700-Heterococcus_DN1.PRE.2